MKLPIQDCPKPTWTPKFGERLLNVFAGDKNPHRVGTFVRVVRRTGRMNPGTWWEMTDQKGDFWLQDPRSMEREKSP